MVKLDQEEQQLLESYERGEWRSVAGEEAEFTRYREYASATFKKNARVNIRITQKDLEALRTRVLEEGTPYQALLASILYKYAGGRLIEKEA